MKVKWFFILFLMGFLISCASSNSNSDVVQSKEYIDWLNEVRTICKKISADGYTSYRVLEDDMTIASSRLSLVDDKKFNRSTLKQFQEIGLKYMEWTRDHGQLLIMRDSAKMAPESVSKKQIQAATIQYGKHIGEKWPY